MESLDKRRIAAFSTLIRDRIYQRSSNLRKTFIELDSTGSGLVPIDMLAHNMARAFQLTDNAQLMVPLLTAADYKHDGVIDFKEFVEMLKPHTGSGGAEGGGDAVMTAEDKRRLLSKNHADKKMVNAVAEGTLDREIKLSTGIPANELGAMTIECPFGVLGDSEKMDAVVATYLSIRLDKLRATLANRDSNNDGFVTYNEFRGGMKEVDRYIFDDEISALIEALDTKKKGLISIDGFVTGVGKEYLKNKAHRSNSAFNSPFVWAEAPPPVPRSMASPRQAEKSKKGPLKPAAMTRGANLRLAGNRHRLELQAKEEEDALRKRLAAGTVKASPRKEGQYTQQSPRLPVISSARKQ